MSSLRTHLTTGIPCFLRVYVAPLCVFKRSTLVPVFTNQKKYKEVFGFYEKRQKMKMASGLGFAASRWSQCAAVRAAWASRSLPQELRSASQRQAS